MSLDQSFRLWEVACADRLERVTYAIRDISVIADKLRHEGHEILPLNIGDPLKYDFRTPRHMVEAVVRAMHDGHNGYAPSLGIPEAVDAIWANAEHNGIPKIQNVFITSGTSEAVDACLTALVNPGENVLTPSPEYPLYTAILTKLEARPNTYDLDEEADWQPDLEQLASRITPETRAIVIINPNNPTGAVYSRRTLETMVELARKHNLLLITDEIYDKLILDGEPFVPLACLAPDLPVITLNGLSKAYLCPGWRVGWGIVSGPPTSVRPYIEAIHKLLRARLCTTQPQQYAIKAALEGPQDHLPAFVQKLRARRDLTMQYLNSIPRLSCVTPHGAFYAFPKLDIETGDEDFIKELLLEKHVLFVHGSGFGQAPGTRHFRAVLLPQEHILRQSYERLAEFIQQYYS
jgi:alanine-synthesizing transaminase